MEKLTGLVRRCVEDYDMLQAGETVAVGVSGGKDSLALLCALASLRRYYPKPFSLHALTVDSGFPDMDFSPVRELCRRLEVPYTIISTDIKSVVFDQRQEKNPCSLCVKMRKGILAENMLRLGIRKIALGHHSDDAVETFFLSLLREGRLHCFMPVTYMDRMGVTQIRPLLYAGEAEILRVANKYSLPVVKSSCPMDKTSQREEVTRLVDQLSLRYPGLRENTARAIRRSPLPGWRVEKNTKD